MSNFDFEPSQEPTFADFDGKTRAEIKELLATLQNSHQLRYKLMNLETWALAETMDQFLPGFWSRFLENRRTALKQFIEQKRHSKTVGTGAPCHRSAKKTERTEAENLPAA